MDHQYHRDERLIIGLAVVLGTVLCVLTIYVAHRSNPSVEQVQPAEVWHLVNELSQQADLDPEFVYALAWAESSLNAKARTSVARGMMQLTRPTWNDMTDESYRLAWEWQINIRVAIDYLVFCRERLKVHDSFSYPLLAASYRYGPSYVQSKDFKIDQIKPSKNEIYKSIFAGNIHPVLVPPALVLADDSGENNF